MNVIRGICYQEDETLRIFIFKHETYPNTQTVYIN